MTMGQLDGNGPDQDFREEVLDDMWTWDGHIHHGELGHVVAGDKP